MEFKDKNIVAMIGITDKGQVVSDAPDDFKNFNHKDPACVIHTFILWALNNQAVTSLFNASVEVDLAEAAQKAMKEKYEKEIWEFNDKLQSGEIKWHGGDIPYFDDDDDGPVYH